MNTKTVLITGGTTGIGLATVGLPADQRKAFEETIVAKSLLKRFGTSDEVARAARFLLSEDSSNITGTELIIDGGVRLN